MNNETVDETVRASLKDLGITPPAQAPLADVTVVLEATRVQAWDTGGLELRFVISSPSGQPVSLKNILDSLNILLTDNHGWPVKLPVGSPPRDIVNYAGKPEIIHPYKLIQFSEYPGGKDLLSTVDEATWTVPSQGNLTVGIRIDRVLPRKVEDPSRASIPIGIEAGQYRIKIIMPLIASPDGRSSRIVGADNVGVELRAEHQPLRE